MNKLLPIQTAAIETSLQDATGQLSKRSKRIYENDAQIFANWLLVNTLTPEVKPIWKRPIG